MNVLIWNTLPSLCEMAAIDAHKKPLYLVICLADQKPPIFAPSEDPSDREKQFHQTITEQMNCIQFYSANVLNHIQKDIHLWLMPQQHCEQLHQYFSPETIKWQTEPIAQSKPSSFKALVQTTYK